MMDVETIFDSDREEYEFMQERKEQPMKEQEIKAVNEIADVLIDNKGKMLIEVAISLYNAGYRKQKEGEWQEENTRTKSAKFVCSVCGGLAYFPQGNNSKTWQKHCHYKFCPNCGAHMRGGKKAQAGRGRVARKRGLFLGDVFGLRNGIFR